MSKRLLVFGGNGFLGKRICQEAVNKGFQVTALSRSGSPPILTSMEDKLWISETKWVSCNVFDPSTYSHLLVDKPHVVHSLGILLENENYKKNVRGSPNIRALFTSSSLFQLPNPLLKKDSKFSYEWMNKRSAMILADAYNSISNKNTKNGSVLPSFTYISADTKFPLIPEGYIHSKREAEEYLLNKKNQFRSIILRPGFMFDEIKGSTDTRSFIQTGIDVLNCGNKLLLNNKLDCINQITRPTISTQQVAKNAITKIQDNDFKGVVYLDELIKI
ncbi:hypothetical protein TPHA_0F02740 [Tetrapisispora phaffii CBS 4417]|uniref:NAD-dependent epimerase/dehydratase domain-containing protein n=1 Tax=Tetrapisispora phaffii (strain ATCC 24235 / CBS 4417 / NBRC 1672 / NRRL Y-8282 / UCD 70-5) TaxID=1071381 RepID=G8BUG8_TETPH|nr:hypothetical protein TPHA_0F02740 [Tetrapisispora phaffii CBS 4417]CCE63754.1 hypothetical protein TPHA_0F02740 [Tetrapisispora phaffii CBS 4417]